MKTITIMMNQTNDKSNIYTLRIPKRRAGSNRLTNLQHGSLQNFHLATKCNIGFFSSNVQNS